MKTSHLITLNIFIMLLLLGGFYYAINKYGTAFLTGAWDKNGVTRVINQKVIQENVNEYRKLSDMQSDVTKVIETVSPSVVHLVRSENITGTGGNVTGIAGGGSAIILTSDGYLATNKHVVADLEDDYTAITSDGKRLNVDKIWHDPVLDLAIIHVTDNTGKAINDLPAASFVSSESRINLGQFAIVLGSTQNTLELAQSLTTVSQKNIAFNATTGDATTNLPYFRIDTQVYAGFSGGPVIDLQGNIIGMTTAMDQGGSLQGGLILPITKELLEDSLLSIKNSGKITRKSFGVTAIPLTPYRAQQMKLKKFNGLYVQKVTSGSIASQVGLLSGDIIQQIDGRDITGDMPFSRYRLGYGSGDTIEFNVYRTDKNEKLSITLK